MSITTARHEHIPHLHPAAPTASAIMINRAALIVRYRQPFVDWINAADPSPTSQPLSLDEVNTEHTVYLIEWRTRTDSVPGWPITISICSRQS